MESVADASRSGRQAAQARGEAGDPEMVRVARDDSSHSSEASGSTPLSHDHSGSSADGAGGGGDGGGAALQPTAEVIAAAAAFVEIPPGVELPIMMQALSRAVVAAARRTVRAAETLAGKESALGEACARCSQALDQRPDALYGDLYQAGVEFAAIMNFADCPPEVWELIQQSCAMVGQVQMVQCGVGGAVELFGALFRAARIALHRTETSVGQAAAPQGFAHSFALLTTAEAAAMHNVESVAHVVDALLALRDTVPEESEGREGIRGASIIIEDAVVLRCCCTVGHRCRTTLVDRLAQAFNRPLDKLEERLLNSYRKNVFGLEGAFSSNSQVQRRNRPKKKRGARRATSQPPSPDAQQDAENSSGGTSGDRSRSESQPSGSDEQQDAENSSCSTPKDRSQSISSSDACAAEEAASHTSSDPSTVAASMELLQNLKMPFPLRVHVEALAKAIMDDNILLENRVECVHALEKLLLDQVNEPFGPGLVSSVAASLSSVLGSTDSTGLGGAVAHTILLSGWEVERFDEALSKIQDALLRQLEVIMFASSSDNEDPILDRARTVLEEVAARVPSFPEGDLRRNVASWVHRDVWEQKTEQCKVLLWRRFTLVGLLFGVQGTICDILSTSKDEYFLEAGYNSLTSVLQAKSRLAPLADSDVERCVHLILDERPQLERTMAAGVRTLTLLMHGAAASVEREEEDSWPERVVLKAAARAMVLAQRCGALKPGKALKYEFAPLLNSALRALQSLFEGAASLKNLTDIVRRFAEQVLQDYDQPQPLYPERQQILEQFPGSAAALFIQEQQDANEEGRRGAIRHASRLIEDHGLRDLQPVATAGAQAESH